MTSDEFERRITGMMQTLYRVSYAMIADRCDREDAVQECLYKAWKKRDALRDERYFQTWVVRILINECRSARRRRRSDAPLEEAPERAAPPDADFAVHDALLRLDERLRLPIVLHYMAGYSIEEVGRLLKAPVGTIKSRMRKGRNALKDLLSGEEERR